MPQMLRQEVVFSPFVMFIIPPSPGTAANMPLTVSSMYRCTPGCDAHIVPMRLS